MTLLTELEALRDKVKSVDYVCIELLILDLTALIDKHKADAGTCKWRLTKVGRTEASPGEIKTGCGIYRNGRLMYATYCPYCGKPIEEVEDE